MQVWHDPGGDWLIRDGPMMNVIGAVREYPAWPVSSNEFRSTRAYSPNSTPQPSFFDKLEFFFFLVLVDVVRPGLQHSRSSVTTVTPTPSMLTSC